MGICEITGMKHGYDTGVTKQTVFGTQRSVPYAAAPWAKAILRGYRTIRFRGNITESQKPSYLIVDMMICLHIHTYIYICIHTHSHTYVWEVS